MRQLGRTGGRGALAGQSVECFAGALQRCEYGPIRSLVRHSPFVRARSRALVTAALVAAVPSACSEIAAARAAAPSSTAAANWDGAQQRQVVAAGLMDGSGGSFDGAGRLSAAQANAAMSALAPLLQSAKAAPGEANGPGEAGGTGEPTSTGEPGGPAEQATTAEQIPSGELTAGGERAATAEPDAALLAAAPVAHTAQSPVTVVTFDGMLVEELGLTPVAAHVQAVAAAVGLRPPAYFGSEVVTRFLELRYEHAVGSQRLDLFPEDPITRAEAAWSLARALDLSAWEVSSTREALTAFALPQPTAAQRQALRIAVSRIGYPYIWGGTTDNTADGLEHGGFDCSGFAWRVYKVSGLPWGREIRGRTAAEQAGEIPRSQRLGTSQLAPGDLLFFGSAHFNSRATEKNIIHEGIYLGDNWVIHSSGQGVYVLPLNGSWLGTSFAWGRRVIR
jgi:cell wall-associated NlpC family hydrolase